MNIKMFIAISAIMSLSACGGSNGSSHHIKTCLTERPPSVKIKGGAGTVGSDSAYPEERSQRRVTVAEFEIDATEVTHAQFKTFVEATGYVTDPEKPQEGFGVPGAAVFSAPGSKTASTWAFVEGADWRNPEGPQSSRRPNPNEPVVQVTLNDARAYAAWAGRRLPTEIEWEYAAKAGADSLYIWGDERAPGGQEKANTWQGAFPIQNTAADGYASLAPVGCYEPNAFGLYDMIGNVWEWTEGEWGNEASNVIKGGSYLCAENFCRRYRASARQGQEVNFSTNHIGFRTVK